MTYRQDHSKYCHEISAVSQSQILVLSITTVMQLCETAVRKALFTTIYMYLRSQQMTLCIYW